MEFLNSAWIGYVTVSTVSIHRLHGIIIILTAKYLQDVCGLFLSQVQSAECTDFTIIIIITKLT